MAWEVVSNERTEKNWKNTESGITVSIEKEMNQYGRGYVWVAYQGNHPMTNYEFGTKREAEKWIKRRMKEGFIRQ
jgi:hypothetical protein